MQNKMSTYKALYVGSSEKFKSIFLNIKNMKHIIL